jgi:hypothetical protein
MSTNNAAADDTLLVDKVSVDRNHNTSTIKNNASFLTELDISKAVA